MDLGSLQNQAQFDSSINQLFSFGIDSQRSNIPTSTFGKTDDEGLVLSGHAYFENKFSRYLHSNHPSISGGFEYGIQHHCKGQSPSAPVWLQSIHNGGNVRDLLPQIVFNNKAEIMQKSGIYTLDVKYNASAEIQNQDAGLIVGEMEFNSSGYAYAEGADWDRLLNNQRQTQLPYSHNTRGLATWLARKICEPWQDGDVIKIKIDTNENTVVFQKGNTPKKTFWNVLAFTNNPKYPEFLRVYAYCGGWSESAQNPDVKLTIVP